MASPLFSFVIPVYDCNRWLGRALASLLQQDATDYEIILVDDGSSEPVQAVLADFSQHPIKLLQQQNAGAGAARNLGIAAARGDYIWCLDCDDELLPGAIQQARAFLTAHPDIVLLVGGHINQSPEGRSRLRLIPPLSPNPEKNFTDFLRKKLGSFSHGAVVVQRQVFERLGYPQGIRSNEDLVLHAQILALHTSASIQTPLVRIHKRPDSQRHSMSGARDAAAKVTDVLFDASILPPAFMGYRAEFQLTSQLELFRDLYKAGLKAEAKQLYMALIRKHPLLALRWSYLKKFIRTLV